jgi:hypothetical protein
MGCQTSSVSAAEAIKRTQSGVLTPRPRKRHMPSENGSHRSRMADTLMSQFQRRPENAFYIEPRSGERYPLDRPRWCADGLKPLLLSPQRGITRDEIERGTRSLWRYQASLPVEVSKPISLGEGCTPLVQREWDSFRPFFKLEWFNPTCSFKDRGTAVMLSYLRQIGVEAVLEDSSGNGGASVAAYGAAGGMRVKIIAPAYTSPAKIAQVRAYGAEVQLVEGPREESEREAIRQSDRIFYSSHNWQPFFLQGTKSIAYELWEDFNFELPDNIIVPVGAGSTLLGCHIGFGELLAAGQIEKLPRLFAAQQDYRRGYRDCSSPAAARNDPRLEGNRRGDGSGLGARDRSRLEAPRPARTICRADIGRRRGCAGKAHRTERDQRPRAHRGADFGHGYQDSVRDCRAFGPDRSVNSHRGSVSIGVRGGVPTCWSRSINIS